MSRFHSLRAGLISWLKMGVAIDLSDKIDTLAPNYSIWRKSDPQMAKDTTTDSGRIIGFQNLLETLQASYYGPVVRQDLLDKVGYNKLPETYDDWTEMLRVLKSATDVAPYYTNYVTGLDTTLQNICLKVSVIE